MRTYRTNNDSMRVGAYEENGQYIIIIEKKITLIVATKGSKNPHGETDFTHYEKRFTDKERANKYFMGIKKNNPTLAEY